MRHLQCQPYCNLWGQHIHTISNTGPDRSMTLWSIPKREVTLKSPYLFPPACGVAKKTSPYVEALKHPYFRSLSLASIRACLTSKPPSECATNIKGRWTSFSSNRLFLTSFNKDCACPATGTLEALLRTLELYAKRRIRAVGRSSGRSVSGQNVPFSCVHVLRACFGSPLGLSPCTNTMLSDCQHLCI